MKCAIIGIDKKIRNGVKLTHEQAVKMSRLAECAAIVDLHESARGYRAIYQDGVVRQYDPVSNTIIGAAQPNRGRVGWIS